MVIEGVRGSGYVGDSAIDDVQLTRGEECLAALRRMMADTVVPGRLYSSIVYRSSQYVPSLVDWTGLCSGRGANQQVWKLQTYRRH